MANENRVIPSRAKRSRGTSRSLRVRRFPKVSCGPARAPAPTRCGGDRRGGLVTLDTMAAPANSIDYGAINRYRLQVGNAGIWGLLLDYGFKNCYNGSNVF